MTEAARAGGEAKRLKLQRKLAPAYEQIKRYVIERIADGTWKPGDAIPSETELVKESGVARMTVSRVLRELSARHVLTRRYF
ncbi:GntR family histidine utilization transcriptional repressor [Paraburkholderia sp. HC6.4b]|nr:GntR family histidine utilization transcriptional repressor [Paraburkholderia sp. HC6.4b]MBB5453803.1 GntR family histidine utilization transcriptional repressor [Paraburkholderia sp. Kb1A]